MDTQVESCLVASGNTYNPSLIVLRQKGYELWLEEGENGSLWLAKKGGQSFLAYSGPNCSAWWSSGNTWARTGINRSRTFSANSPTRSGVTEINGFCRQLYPGRRSPTIDKGAENPRPLDRSFTPAS